MSGIAGRFGPDSGRFLPQIPVKSGNFRPEYSPWGVAVYGRNWWQVWSGISIRIKNKKIQAILVLYNDLTTNLITPRR